MAHSPTVAYALQNAPASVSRHLGAVDVVGDRFLADMAPILEALIRDSKMDPSDAQKLRDEVKDTIHGLRESIEYFAAWALIANEERKPDPFDFGAPSVEYHHGIAAE